MKNQLLVFGAAVFVLGSVAPVGVAIAHDGVEDGHPNEVSSKVSSTLEKRKAEAQLKLEQAKKEAQAKMQEKRTEIKEKLDAKRLKVCEARQNKINEINKNFGTRASERLTKLAAATDKLVAIKTSKDLAVVNYDSLLADVNAKAAAAQAAVANVQAVNFTCADEGANREYGQYVKSNVLAVHGQVKEYRAAVKALAEAVRAAAVAQAQTSTNAASEQE